MVLGLNVLKLFTLSYLDDTMVSFATAGINIPGYMYCCAKRKKAGLSVGINVILPIQFVQHGTDLSNGPYYTASYQLVMLPSLSMAKQHIDFQWLALTKGQMKRLYFDTSRSQPYFNALAKNLKAFAKCVAEYDSSKHVFVLRKGMTVQTRSRRLKQLKWQVKEVSDTNIACFGLLLCVYCFPYCMAGSHLLHGYCSCNYNQCIFPILSKCSYACRRISLKSPPHILA
jgi:hypothetical protein